MTASNQQAASTQPLSRFTTERLLTLLELVNHEVLRAQRLFPPLHSAHEAYGVLAEELAEFFDHVKTNPKNRDLSAMSGELIQLAAMALRSILDLVPEEQA